MVVPGRNRTLFRCVFRPRYRVQSAVAQNFRLGWGSYMLRRLNRYSCIFAAHMSPTLINGSFVLQRFERGNAVKLRNGIMSDFYPGLPNITIRRAPGLITHCYHYKTSLTSTVGKGWGCGWCCGWCSGELAGGGDLGRGANKLLSTWI